MLLEERYLIDTGATGNIDHTRDVMEFGILIAFHEEHLLARRANTSCSRDRRAVRSTNCVFNNTLPVSLTSTTIAVSFTVVEVFLAGSGTFVGNPFDRFGVETMKIMSSTSRTSIKGVTLSSAFLRPVVIPGWTRLDALSSWGCRGERPDSHIRRYTENEDQARTLLL
jgi:hypothetical protein